MKKSAGCPRPLGARTRLTPKNVLHVLSTEFQAYLRRRAIVGIEFA